MSLGDPLPPAAPTGRTMRLVQTLVAWDGSEKCDDVAFDVRRYKSDYYYRQQIRAMAIRELDVMAEKANGDR